MQQRSSSSVTPATRRGSGAGNVWVGESQHELAVPVISEVEESVLTKISTSHQFALEQTLGLYAGVRRLSDTK